MAGVNGAGKSSVIGSHIAQYGSAFYNPDAVAHAIRSSFPDISLRTANSVAWRRGVAQLKDAVSTGRNYAFETTLASSQITAELVHAAQHGFRLSVFYVGLESVELHAERVRQRHAKGGHHIPFEDIVRRWSQSPLNLATLVPWVNDLILFDNSQPAPEGADPRPVELLRVIDDRPVAPLDVDALPDWAGPAVHALQRRFGQS